VIYLVDLHLAVIVLPENTKRTQPKLLGQTSTARGSIKMSESITYHINARFQKLSKLIAALPVVEECDNGAEELMRTRAALCECVEYVKQNLHQYRSDLQLYTSLLQSFEVQALQTKAYIDYLKLTQDREVSHTIDELDSKITQFCNLVESHQQLQQTTSMPNLSALLISPLESLDHGPVCSFMDSPKLADLVATAPKTNNDIAAQFWFQDEPSPTLPLPIVRSKFIDAQTLRLKISKLFPIQLPAKIVALSSDSLHLIQLTWRSPSRVALDFVGKFKVPNEDQLVTPIEFATLELANQKCHELYGIPPPSGDADAEFIFLDRAMYAGYSLHFLSQLHKKLQSSGGVALQFAVPEDKVEDAREREPNCYPDAWKQG